MPTLLTALFPSGYRRGEHAATGSLDEVSVVDETTGERSPFDGSLVIGHSIALRGWAIDAERGLPAGGVLLTIDGTVFEAEYGQPRGDVAAAYRDPSVCRCGFSAVVALPPSSRGSAELRLYAVAADASTIAPLGEPISISVRGATLQLTAQIKAGEGVVEIHADEWSAGAETYLLGSTPAIAVDRGALLEIVGWAKDCASGRAASPVYLRVGDDVVVRAASGIARPDVVAGTNNPELHQAGYRVRLDTSGITAGTHPLRIVAVSQDGSTAVTLDLPPLELTSRVSAGVDSLKKL